MPTEYNPMRYTCALNAAGPDYVTATDVRTFIAYVMLRCWLGTSATDPNHDIYLARPVTLADVQELRTNFLIAFETFVAAYWRGEFTIPTNGSTHVDLDWAYRSIEFGPPEPDRVDADDPRGPAGPIGSDDVVYVGFNIDLYTDGIAFSLLTDGDPSAFWLAYSALDSRDDVLAALAEARAPMDFAEDQVVSPQLRRLAAATSLQYYQEVISQIWTEN